MTRILVLNGSPKCERSTTLAVTRAFVEGLQKAGAGECETLHVSKLNVKPCMDCLGCWGRSEGECLVRGDDVSMVKSKILEADTIVLSFPLFFFGLPGEMKVLLDRLLSLLNAYCGQDVPEGGSFHGFRYDVSKKKLVLISGCAWNDSKVFEPLTKQFDCIVGAGRYTAIFCPQIKAIVDQGMRPRLVRYLNRYRVAGEEFAQNGKLSAETAESLRKTPFSKQVYAEILAKFWADEKEAGNGHS